MLLQVVAESEPFLPALAEKLTLIGALAFFLYYFMKELKELRKQHEATRKEYEGKLETITERLIKVEESSRNALEQATESNSKLADAVDRLANRISQSSQKF